MENKLLINFTCVNIIGPMVFILKWFNKSSDFTKPILVNFDDIPALLIRTLRPLSLTIFVTWEAKLKNDPWSIRSTNN